VNHLILIAMMTVIGPIRCSHYDN